MNAPWKSRGTGLFPLTPTLSLGGEREIRVVIFLRRPPSPQLLT